MFKKRLITVDEAASLMAPKAVLDAAIAREGSVCQLIPEDGGKEIFSPRPFVPGDAADGTSDEEALGCLGAFFHYAAGNPERFPSFSAAKHEDLYRQSMRYVAHVIVGARPTIERQSLEIGRSMMDGSMMMTGYDQSAQPADVARFDPEWPNEEIVRLLASLRSSGQFSLAGLVERQVFADLAGIETRLKDDPLLAGKGTARATSSGVGF